ncbi:MAG: DMT family transporter [Polyangiaceae bacterium]|nr:DMT family transporter [Polyangiaceae bacterium]
MTIRRKALVALFFMGLIPLLVRIVHADPLAIGVVRLTLATSLTAFAFRNQLSFSRSFIKKPGLFLSLGALFAAHWFTYFLAIQSAGAALGFLALSTYGVHLTWLGAFFTSHRPGIIEWFCVFLAGAGAWCAAPSPTLEPEQALGFGIGLVSAILYALTPILHQRNQDIPLYDRNLGQFSIALLCFLPFSFFAEFPDSSKDWLILVVLGVCCTFIAHNLWIEVSSVLPPQVTGTIYYLALPMTLILEGLVLRKSPTQGELTGAALIIGGNLLAVSARGRQRRLAAA